MAMIELGQVAPDHLFAVFVTKGVGDAPIGLMDKPLRVLPNQAGIRRAVIDDQINHHAQSLCLGKIDRIA